MSDTISDSDDPTKVAIACQGGGVTQLSPLAF